MFDGDYAAQHRTRELAGPSSVVWFSCFRSSLAFTPVALLAFVDVAPRMTVLEIARWVLGVHLALFAGEIAFVTGRFMMAFLGESSHSECSEAFLNPVTRWLLYYVAVPVVTVGAFLVLPSWVAATAAVVWVACRWFRGTRAQIERGLPHYVHGMHATDPSLSVEEARRRMARSLYRNLRVRMTRPVLEPFARIYYSVTGKIFHRDE